MAEKKDFQATFERLKKILYKYEKRLTVVADTPGNYYLDAGFSEKFKRTIFFGAVTIQKNYVSFHLMPVYAFPDLLKGISPTLKKRMQGKSCFNFTTIDDAMLAELAKLGGVLLDGREKRQLEGVMFPNGKLSSTTTAQSAPRIAELAGLERGALKTCRFIMVEESGTGRSCPFSGEKLAPVLAIYKARDFDEAFRITRDIYDYQGRGHSVGIHTRDDGHVMRLGLELEVCRVIVNQAHCIATGGSFDNGLPFSLSMGCGTWGRNSFSENMNYRHFLNTTRIARVIPENMPSDEDLFGPFWKKYGK
mgnify:CR=1 FL=1